MMTATELADANAQFRAKHGRMVPMSASELTAESAKSRAVFVERVRSWSVDERQLRLDLHDLAEQAGTLAASIREHLERLQAAEELRGESIFEYDASEDFIVAAKAVEELCDIIDTGLPSAAAIKSVPQ